MTTTFTSHNFFMKRCIELAKLGAGKVAPNPMVGAVIVHNNVIIGEGYHECFGGAHAEVNAINQVKDKSLLKTATIYVSLEPCAHQGKTPPCADLIVKHEIPNVVIGMQDPFSEVNGAGIKILKNAGSKVTIGILEKQCLELNKEFITYHTKKRPYIILKWAETADGFIDKERKENEPQQPNWITNETCRALVHKWRSETKAILVGTNTALTDNPKLDVRTWSGNSPLRIVLDRQLRLPENLHLFNTKQPTLVINEKKSESNNTLEYIRLDFNDILITNLLHLLYKKGVSSIIIEGGQKVLSSFIEQNYWDEARIFVGNLFFKKGIKAPTISKYNVKPIQIGTSNLFIVCNE